MRDGRLRKIKMPRSIQRRVCKVLASSIVMINRHSVFRRMTRFLRQVFGAGVVALMLIAQVNAAVDGCFLERVAGSHDSGAVSAGALHAGIPDIHCVTEPGFDAQAPAPDNKQFLTGYAAGRPLVLRWDSAHRSNERLAQFEPPGTGLPYILQFQRLRI